MSGHASAASEVSTAQNCLHSDNKRTLPHDAEPDADIHSESYEEPGAQIHSENKRKADAEIQSESYKEPVPHGDSESYEENNCARYQVLPREIRNLQETLIERVRDSDAKNDDGQQRLVGPSLYGRKPRRWISEEEWLNYMKEDPHVRPRLSSVTIFKIPSFLKDTKWEAYVPQRISLGPYHHGTAELAAMDHYKGKALRKMMTRFNKKKSLDVDDVSFAKDARNAILMRDKEIRDCYEEFIDCDENTLARMLSLDGCFILEVLNGLDKFKPDKIDHTIFGESMVAADHTIFGKSMVAASSTDKIDHTIFGESMVAASSTLKDILMLENQIPWIVLLELLKLENENPSDHDVEMTLLNLMANGTYGLFKIYREDKAALLQLEWLKQDATEVHHILDFVHKVIVHRPSNQANPGNQGQHRIWIKRYICWCLHMFTDKAPNHDFQSIPPAVELKNAGINFRPYNGGIEQIKFDPDSSTIYLPLLSITYDIEVLFRNLIAWEICKSPQVNYISSYVNLMDDLIDSQKDVAFLRSMGILTNLLGSDEEVADLFNGLFKGVTVRTSNMFDELKKNVNANYKNRIRVRLAELWRDHLSSPWKFIALAVAFAILCLTLLQTIYTVKK